MAEQADEVASRQALQAWYRKNSERILARQHTQVDNAKILVGLTLAAATTLVATALQVSPIKITDIFACILLGFCFLLSVAAIFMDRLKEPDTSYAERRARTGGNNWSDAQLLEFLEEAATRAEEDGEKVVYWVKAVARMQVVTVGATCVIATFSLIGE